MSPATEAAGVILDKVREVYKLRDTLNTINKLVKDYELQLGTTPVSRAIVEQLKELSST